MIWMSRSNWVMFGQTQLVHAGNSKSTSTEEMDLGVTGVHTGDTRLRTQVLKLIRGDQGWDSDNLGQATFAVWIHSDSPINSALLDKFLCLPQRAIPAEACVCHSVLYQQRQAASSILARLSGHRPLPHQPQDLRRSKTHWIWGSE